VCYPLAHIIQHTFGALILIAIRYALHIALE
jgi:hypothetical protein